ncbi:hypothetical protein PLESTM_000948700 [Pleodorina starrii]|nr:hypothetical protein PLESTM_000948700 [Pleodorina starrii]
MVMAHVAELKKSRSALRPGVSYADSDDVGTAAAAAAAGEAAAEDESAWGQGLFDRSRRRRE